MTFVQIVELGWLSGQQKGLIFIKMLKNLLLRNYKGDEAETWLDQLANLHSATLRYLVTLPWHGVEVQQNTDGDTPSKTWNTCLGH